MLPGLPRSYQRLDILVIGHGRVDLEIILAECVRSVIVSASFAYLGVASPAPPPFKLRQRTMHADEKDITRAEQAQQAMHPRLRFDDVLDDQIVPRVCKGGYAAVKSVEER